MTPPIIENKTALKNCISKANQSFVGNPEDWNKEQLRAMALFTWIGFTILFIVWLVFPEYRFYKLYQ